MPFYDYNLITYRPKVRAILTSILQQKVSLLSSISLLYSPLALSAFNNAYLDSLYLLKH